MRSFVPRSCFLFLPENRFNFIGLGASIRSSSPATQNGIFTVKAATVRSLHCTLSLIRNVFSSLPYKDDSPPEDLFASDLKDTLKHIEQASAEFFAKEPVDNIVGLTGFGVSVAAAQLCRCSSRRQYVNSWM